MRTYPGAYPALLVFIVVCIVSLVALLCGPAVYEQSLRPGDLNDEYDNIARALLNGHGYSASVGPDFPPTVTRAPLYPLYMAAIFGAFGQDAVQAVRAADCVLHAVAAALIAGLLCHLTSTRAAVFGGLLYALWPTTLYYVLKGNSETMLCACFAGAMYMLVRIVQNPRLATACGLGLLLGLSCLTRGTGAVISALFIGLLAVSAFRRRGIARLIPAILVMYVGVMSPWWLRNYRLTGEFVPFHTLVWWNACFNDVVDGRLAWLAGMGMMDRDFCKLRQDEIPEWLPKMPEGDRYPVLLHANEDLRQERRYKALMMERFRDPRYLSDKMIRNAIEFWSRANTVRKTRLLLASSLVWIALFAVSVGLGASRPSARWFVGVCALGVILQWGLYLPTFSAFRFSVASAPFVACAIAIGLDAAVSARTRQHPDGHREDRTLSHKV